MHRAGQEPHIATKRSSLEGAVHSDLFHLLKAHLGIFCALDGEVKLADWWGSSKHGSRSVCRKTRIVGFWHFRDARACSALVVESRPASGPDPCLNGGSAAFLAGAALLYEEAVEDWHAIAYRAVLASNAFDPEVAAAGFLLQDLSRSPP
jgi:hypothetical protein